MSRVRRRIQDVRKRWARRRSKSLAPNKEDQLYRMRTPPDVLDPRIRTGRRK
jgi:hypothetical protein